MKSVSYSMAYKIGAAEPKRDDFVQQTLDRIMSRKSKGTISSSSIPKNLKQSYDT